MEREYGWCKGCNEYVYRDHTDFAAQDDPAWLLTDEKSVRADGIDPDTVPEIDCGCTDH